MIEISEKQIDRVNLILGGLKNAPQKAFSGIINRALSTARSQSGKSVRQTYHIRQRDITDNQNMKVKRAGGSNLVGEISFAGTVIPLVKFNVNPTQPQRNTVSVAVLRQGGGQRLIHAYVADLGRHGVGVFERETSRRDSSKQLYGPSPAHMMDNANVMSEVEAATLDTIDKRVEHEITRILNGFV